jgi:hypothetical protein
MTKIVVEHKKLHWTQRPGGKKKASAAAKKGHVTKGTRKKPGPKSRAEEAVVSAAASRPMKTKIDVLVEQREHLHEDIMAYLRNLTRTTEVDDRNATAAVFHGSELLTYIRTDINRLKDGAAEIRRLNNGR